MDELLFDNVENCDPKVISFVQFCKQNIQKFPAKSAKSDFNFQHLESLKISDFEVRTLVPISNLIVLVSRAKGQKCS